MEKTVCDSRLEDWKRKFRLRSSVRYVGKKFAWTCHTVTAIKANYCLYEQSKEVIFKFWDSAVRNLSFFDVDFVLSDFVFLVSNKVAWRESKLASSRKKEKAHTSRLQGFRLLSLFSI